MRHAGVGVVIVLGTACGRVGFDPAGNGAPNDVPEFAEPGGRLDPSFGTDGMTVAGLGDLEHLQDVLVRPGGGYLAAGYRQIGASSTTFELIAFTADGRVDPSYGINGYAFPSFNGSDYGFGLVERPDGTIVAIGDGANGNDDIVVTALDDRGTMLPDFGASGFRTVNSGVSGNDSARRGAQIGTTTYVCGVIRYDQPSADVAILALDPQGGGVPSFDTDGVVFDPVSAQYDECSDIVADRSGRLAISGTTNGGPSLARYSPTGDRDVSFAGSGFVQVGPDGTLYGVALAANDDLVAAGADSGEGLLVRYTSAGTPAAFGIAGVVNTGATLLTDVVIQDDGKIVAGGERMTGALTDIVIQRFHADGTPDRSFGSNGELVIDVSAGDRLRALRQDADRKLIAVGYVSQLGADRPWIARIK